MAYFQIIIPNYNNEQYIENCVESIENQTFKDYKIFIIDDVSTDNSIEKIDKLEDKYQNIESFLLDTKSFNGGTRNVGITQLEFKNCFIADDLKTKYTIFIDGDDTFTHNKVLEDIYNICKKSNPDMVRLSYNYCKDGSKIPVILDKNTPAEVVADPNVACWLKVVKTELVQRFPENTLMEDVVHHIKQLDVIDTIECYTTPAINWNRDNVNSCSQNRTLQNNKWNSSMYRYIADLLDLQCKHDYCEAERQLRLSCAIKNLRAGNMTQDKT